MELKKSKSNKNPYKTLKLLHQNRSDENDQAEPELEPVSSIDSFDSLEETLKLKESRKIKVNVFFFIALLYN